ncbi:MAG TPA: hypothetical protein VF676_05905 [Flavobacterium sp.]|jgi:hypothetical protein
MKSLHRPIPGNEKAFKATTRVMDNFEDLYDEKLQDMYWTQSTLMKAMPKVGPKIKKMKSR